MLAAYALTLLTLALSDPRGSPARGDSGVYVRVNGDLVIGAEERNAGALVIRGNARVAGTVRGLVVVGGDAVITGGRVTDLTVVRGRAMLSDSATVAGDVHLVDAELTVESGARVLGTVERRVGRRLLGDVAGVASLFGLGVAVAILVAGAIGAAVVPGALRHTGDVMTRAPGSTVLAALLLWFGAPVIAVMLALTVLFAPMAIGYFLFVLPVLAFLGLVVAGTKLGDVALGRYRGRIEATRPYLAALTGLGALLLLSRVPLLGALLPLAAMAGSGAIAVTAWRMGRGRAAA